MQYKQSPCWLLWICTRVKTELEASSNRSVLNTYNSSVKHQYFQDRDLIFHNFVPLSMIVLVCLIRNNLKSCHCSMGCHTKFGQCHPTAVSSFSVLFVTGEVPSKPSQPTVTLRMKHLYVFACLITCFSNILQH